jgi:murein L,D-transpeptidase YcbB/YkuD
MKRACRLLLVALSLASRSVASGPEPCDRDLAGARLAAAIADYRRIQGRGGWQPLPEGPALAPGARGPRVAALRARLMSTRDLTAEAPSDGFDETLEAAVRHFQRRHGLSVDGVVGDATRTELNVPVEERIATLRTNLERMRSWNGLTRRLLLVNVPAFEVYAIEEGKEVFATRAIVGLAGWPTPEVTGRVDRIVVYPSWTVPPRIVRRELIARMRRDPRYLDREGILVFTRSDAGGRPVDPLTVDWKSPQAALLRFWQPPGATNPLGRLKFVFDNPYRVYLHDTPKKRLFARPLRALSHGCIRVEGAMEIASWLLRGQDDWTPETLATAILTGGSSVLRVRDPADIETVYWTAWVDDQGDIQFRRDIYHRDRSRHRSAPAKKAAADVGP